MIGPAFVLAGVVCGAMSVAISFNTSMGGTRSDYTDSSGIWAALAALSMLAGCALTLAELLS